MLILTRKVNQKLIINDDIEVVILDACKNSVKIGVRAPKNVQVYREEIYNEIKKSNKQANNIDVSAISSLKLPNNAGFDLMKKIQQHDNK